MTKAKLTPRIAAHTSTSKAGADVTVNAVRSTIADALDGDKTVTMAGFETFLPKSRSARKRRNLRTGERITIYASRAPSHRPTKSLRCAVT